MLVTKIPAKCICCTMCCISINNLYIMMWILSHDKLLKTFPIAFQFVDISCNQIIVVVVVVFLATGLCSVTELWGGAIPTFIKDCYDPRIHHYCYILYIIPLPPFDLFLDPSPSPSVSWLPLSPVTLRRSCTALCNGFSTRILVLDWLAKQASIPVGLHCPSCTRYLDSLYLLLKSLSSPTSPLHEPVSSALSPVQFSPFSVIDVNSN